MASSVNVVRVDLTRTLPRPEAQRSGNGLSLACCPARAALTTAEAQPPGVGLDLAQVSILDGDHTVAQTMARVLQTEGFSARAFLSAPEFMAQPEPALAGCLVADASTPGRAGLELLRELTARQSLLPVILLIAPGDTRTVVKGMKAGAINCLPKPVQRAELLEAVREALAESRAVRAQRAAQLRVRQMLERLTPREREVLDLALDGLLVKQIAARLGTAEKTIKTHKGRLMRKMEVRSTLALVQLMVNAGIPPVASAGQPSA
ncbi:MAG TPA: LuxR C-terminal-related transcriptional regulator [Steroidobacteraceae bacterium]|nr:LuxR C-terminal-related transcriptional regulator [Steroidobacteraceae bacterium]